MAVVVWPPSLPQFMQLEEQETPPDVLIRSPMDVGPDKVRPRFTAAPRFIEGWVEMTPAQVDIFDAFYADTIRGGLDPFEWVIPRSNSVVDFLFAAVPEYQSASDSKNTYRVMLRLMVMPELFAL